MLINGVSVPQEDGRGRLFPYKDTGPHFVGPVLVGGVIYKGKIWQNTAENGRQYLRLILDPVEVGHES